MKMKIYVITGFIAAMLAGICFFIDPKISWGVLLSAAYSLVNMALLSFTMKLAVSQSVMNSGPLVIGNILRFSLMAAVIFIALRHPDIFSIIGVAIGFTLFLFALMADAVSRKGR